MAAETGISWADATWNPWIGCVKVSPGCTNCYAEDLARARMQSFGGAALWRGQHHRTKSWGDPGRWDRKAAKEGRRIRLFVASMADVFEAHPDLVEWRREALEVLSALTNTDVMLLTKRPQNVRGMVPAAWLAPGGWPAHVWLGTTVEDQQRAEERVPALLRIPARVRFLSCEPLLGPLDLAPWLGDGGPEWVIVGGESGPRARPACSAWFGSIRDQCAEAGTPFHFKQHGEHLDGVRVGKAAAGHLLDGVEHLAFPGAR